MLKRVGLQICSLNHRFVVLGSIYRSKTVFERLTQKNKNKSTVQFIIMKENVTQCSTMADVCVLIVFGQQ